MSAPAHVSLVARGLSVSRGGRQVLTDVAVTVTDNTRLALLGPNGVGKSSLLAVLAGRLHPDAGQVTLTPPGATVGLVEQQLDRRSERTARELLAEQTGVASAQVELDAATADLATGAEGADDRYTAALDRWLAVGAADLDARLGSVTAEIGLDPHVLDRPVAALSGGECARVGLAAVLLSRFDVVLLDEPTNDLDPAGLETLEAWTTAHEGGVVLVSHDRSFLERTVTSVLEIDEHTRTTTLFQGGWDAFVADRAASRRHAEERYDSYRAERDRLAGRAQQQREWAAKGASRARKHPADGDKFRRAHDLAQTEKMVGRAKATQRALDRLERVDKPWEGWDLRFAIAPTERSGSVVASLDDAVIRLGDFALGPIDLEIRWAERVALAGSNGVGKTSVIGALLGRVPLASGHAHLGPSVVVGELDQARRAFHRPEASLLEVFEERAGLPTQECRSVLAKFGLPAEAVARPAASLSPGERTRAQLALFQARGVNLLVLDEPTNHLDLPAIEQLEQALASYGGTLLVVSHDRWFTAALRVDRTIDVADLASRSGRSARDGGASAS